MTSNVSSTSYTDLVYNAIVELTKDGGWAESWQIVHATGLPVDEVQLCLRLLLQKRRIETDKPISSTGKTNRGDIITIDKARPAT